MRHAWVAGLLALAVAASCTRARHDYADIVFRGGPVYTVDSAKPHATAVTGTRIVFVGDDSGAAMFVGPRTRVIELKGRMLLPAFHDSHVHPVTAGLRLSECALDELTTPAQIADSIARCAKAHPSDAWFLGHGWQLPVFPHANPGRALLDRLIPDRPAYVGAADGHSAWVNSRALALAHVSARTPDPPDGRIERDAAGNPSGTLREGATDLVEKFLPSVTAEQRVDGLARAIRYANSLGIVALQEASADSEILVAYQTLDRRDSLNARVVVSIYVDPAAGVSQLPRMIRLRDQFAGNRDRATGAKIFADGVIESHTSAHLEMIDTLDLPRFKSLGVFANFQPLWAFRDSYIRELTEPVLGPERSSRLYPIGSVAAAGGTIVGGSDWGVSSLNPLEAIQVGVTRCDPAAASCTAWLPRERVTLDRMIAAYTIEGAQLAFDEKISGSITAGKAADLVVLDRDLFAIRPEQISKAHVLLTLLDGHDVYRDASVR